MSQADELLTTHPLFGLGMQAVANQETADPPELDKFNDAIAQYSLSRSANWEEVLTLASAVAARRLDIKVYGYLALAAFHSEREIEDGEPYTALGAAMNALRDVISQRWELCQPRIPAKRQSLLKWMSEELSEPVKARAPKSREAQSFLACQQACEQLASAAGTAMGFDYPLLREVREAIASHRAAVDQVLAKQREAQKAAAPEPPAPKPEVAAPSAEKIAIPTAEIAQSDAVKKPAPADSASSPAPEAGNQASAAPANEALPKLDDMNQDALADHLASATARLAASLRAAAIADPSAYWISRALSWANHDLLRPERAAELATNKYKTPLPVPQGHKNLSKQLPARLAQGQHAAVLAECEDLFPLYPLWLDLQRWAAQALDALGPEAAAARRVVTYQVALLLARCPDVARFRYADRDATPVADAETQTWLESERSRIGTAASPADSRVAVEEALPEGLAPGVQQLQRMLDQAGSGRQRFELRLRIAELLLRHQRSDIAVPILTELLAVSETQHLREWQPDLMARVLRLSVEAARAAELDKTQRSLLWAKLCHENPVEALILGPEQN